MASVRETNNLIMKKLDCLEKTTSEVRTCVKGNSEKLDRIHPQSYLPAIPRPKQGVGISRTSSIATYLRNEITLLNATKKDGEPRYLEFPDEVTDKQVNTDALNCLEIILMFHLDFHYGRMSWEKVTKKMPRIAAIIYREARKTPELAVFAQTAALWAIDLLLTAEMKSRMRSNHDETNNQKRVETIPDVRISDEQAVSVVPEIVPNPIDHGPVNTFNSIHNTECNGVRNHSAERVEEINHQTVCNSPIASHAALAEERCFAEAHGSVEEACETEPNVEEEERGGNGGQVRSGALGRRGGGKSRWGGRGQGGRGRRGGRGGRRTLRGGVQRRVISRN